MCCGRSLVLPLMRYYAKEVDEYIGIDIEPKNIIAYKKNITNGKAINAKYFYPFKVDFKVGNVAEMPFEDNYFDLIIYTSAIEHMQKKDGEKSMEEAHRVLKRGGELFLSCPNTPEDRDGFDTQYRAHLYEWKISEIEKMIKELRMEIILRIGLVINKNDLLEVLDEKLKSFYDIANSYLPNEFLQCLFSIPYYKKAKEVLFILKK